MTDTVNPDNSGSTGAGAGPPRRVFISYSSRDATVAQKACSALEGAGFPCWIAPRDVVPGTLYADGIIRAINESSILVLVLSEHSTASTHVGKELERAASKRHPIIALRTDMAPLPPAFEYFLSESQWIDAGTGNTDAAIPQLMAAVRQHLFPGSKETPSPLRAAHAIKRPSAMLRRIWVVASAAIVFTLAVAYFSASKVWLHNHSASAIRVGGGPSEKVDDKSIAVLPFVDMSEKKDQEYFADGMAEEILDLLAKTPGLVVIGRTSSFQFKGKNEDLRTIGEKLNAAYVLEGSLRSSGNQVRITAQLISTRTGTHEWSETYDRPIGDVLKLQDAVAAAVVRELQLAVAPERLGIHATVKSAEAYDLYLRGRHALDRTDSDGSDEAVMLFQHSLDRDPTFADAAAGLSRAYANQVLVGSLAPAAGFEQARRAATISLKLDPNSVSALVSMANIHIIYDWDWVGAERELKQAATLAPGNMDVLFGQATLSATLGRLDDALTHSKAAVAQDPLDADLLQSLSTMQEARGNLREAEVAMRRALDIRPTYAYGHFNLGLIFLMRGDLDDALREIQQETINDGKQQGLALVYYALGRKADADTALAVLIKDQAEGNALDIAEVYAFRGQSNEAMLWLERAYAQKNPWLFQIKHDWLMKDLKADPRYAAFLRKMNLPD